MPDYWIAIATASALFFIIVSIVLWRRHRRTVVRQERRRAIAAFPSQRPALAALFLDAAGATGKPRGLRWKSCELTDGALFAVDRVTGELYALAGATISFEAVEGGGMEEVEAVGNLRSATAVFLHRDDHWTTDGRVVFNLEPAEALKHYEASLKPV